MSFGTFTNIAGSAGFPAFTFTFTLGLAEMQNLNTHPRPAHSNRQTWLRMSRRPRKLRFDCRRRAAPGQNFFCHAPSETRKPSAPARATIRSQSLPSTRPGWRPSRCALVPPAVRRDPATVRCSASVNGRIRFAGDPFARACWPDVAREPRAAASRGYFTPRGRMLRGPRVSVRRVCALPPRLRHLPCVAPAFPYNISRITQRPGDLPEYPLVRPSDASFPRCPNNS
jgi:hypothetical protein